MSRLSKNGKLKEERNYQQFRVKNKLVPSFKGEFSSTIEILVKMVLSGEAKPFSNKFQYEWITKDYDSANRNNDFLTAFSEVFSGENIRFYLPDHPKARLILEHRKTLHESTIIPHTILKRIDFFNQLERVYIATSPTQHSIKLPVNDEQFREFTINNNGKFVSSTGKEITPKNLASLAVLAWYHYEKDPHGRNYGVKPVYSDDEQMFFFKVDNTKSLWTLDPRHFARPNKTEKDHAALSKGILSNWFLDKLKDYVPDYFFFYKMDPRILTSNDFKLEMHETILAILETSIINTAHLIKSYFPQHLFVEKSGNELDGSSDDEDASSSNHALEDFNAKQFVTQIIRIILCLLARKNQLLQWVSTEPEFISFMHMKGKSIDHLIDIVGHDNKLFSEIIVMSEIKENIPVAGIQIPQTDIIPLSEIEDLFTLPAFPVVLKDVLLRQKYIPNLGLSWGVEKILKEEQVAVLSPQSSPVRSIASSANNSPARCSLQNSPSNSVHLSGSSPRAVVSSSASPSKRTNDKVNIGASQQQVLSPKRGTLFSVSLSNNASSSPHKLLPSCKQELLGNENDDHVNKRPRLLPTDLRSKFGF